MHNLSNTLFGKHMDNHRDDNSGNNNNNNNSINNNNSSSNYHWVDSSSSSFHSQHHHQYSQKSSNKQIDVKRISWNKTQQLANTMGFIEVHNKGMTKQQQQQQQRKRNSLPASLRLDGGEGGIIYDDEMKNKSIVDIRRYSLPVSIERGDIGSCSEVDYDELLSPMKRLDRHIIDESDDTTKKSAEIIQDDDQKSPRSSPIPPNRHRENDDVENQERQQQHQPSISFEDETNHVSPPRPHRHHHHHSQQPSSSTIKSNDSSRRQRRNSLPISFHRPDKDTLTYNVCLPTPRTKRHSMDHSTPPSESSRRNRLSDASSHSTSQRTHNRSMRSVESIVSKKGIINSLKRSRDFVVPLLFPMFGHHNDAAAAATSGESSDGSRRWTRHETGASSPHRETTPTTTESTKPQQASQKPTRGRPMLIRADRTKRLNTSRKYLHRKPKLSVAAGYNAGFALSADSDEEDEDDLGIVREEGQDDDNIREVYNDDDHHQNSSRATPSSASGPRGATRTASHSTSTTQTDSDQSADNERREAKEALHYACWTDTPVDHVEGLLAAHPSVINDDVLNKSPLDVVVERARCCMCGCCNYNRRRVIMALMQGEEYYKAANSGGEDWEVSSIGYFGDVAGGDGDLEENRDTSVITNDTYVSIQSLSSCFTSSSRIKNKDPLHPNNNEELHQDNNDTSSASTSTNSSSLPHIPLTEELLAQRDEIEKQLLFERERLWLKYKSKLQHMIQIRHELNEESNAIARRLAVKTREIDALQAELRMRAAKREMELQETNNSLDNNIKRIFGAIGDNVSCSINTKIGLLSVDKSDLELGVLCVKEQQMQFEKKYENVMEHIFGKVDRQICHILGESSLRKNCARECEMRSIDD